MVKPIQRITATEATVQRLRTMIFSGELAAGSPLRQEELSKSIGVSRTPLREAIARLDAEGFVVQDPHCGASVYQPTPQDLIECFEIQRALEPLAARLAAENRKDNELEQVAILLHGFANKKTAKAWADHNEKFHLHVYSLARRTQLLELIRHQYTRSKMYIRILIGEGAAPRAEKDHEAIYNALKQKDGTRIQEILHRHIDETVKTVLMGLNKR
jgi:DNA-binding GntR family transcriptional regulator